MKALVIPFRRFRFAVALGSCLVFGACGAVTTPKGEIALVNPSAAEPLPVVLPDDPSPSQRYAVSAPPVDNDQISNSYGILPLKGK